VRQADVAVIGGGPAGLAAALELRARGVGSVVVVEREARAGGIPRHADHQGFGLRDLRRPLRGPAYAERYRQLALAAGVTLREQTQATGWTAAGALELTSPAGRESLTARAVLLASGCRERPRAARLVAGTRPAGVMTTGELQQRVHLYGERLDGTAVVVGAEHVSFSAIETLDRAGARTAALVTELPRHQSLEAFRLGARVRYGTAVWTATRVRSILGSERVEAVELERLDGGAIRTVACRTVVFSADWVPDMELGALAGCRLAPGSLAPRVDPDGRTTVAGLWAAGNVVHPAETADVAALGARHVAAAVAAELVGGPAVGVATDLGGPAARLEAGGYGVAIDLDALAPLRWVSPSLLAPGSAARGHAAARPARSRFVLRSDAFLRRPVLAVRQDGRELWRGRLWRLVPGRSASIPVAWLDRLDPGGGPVTVGVA